MLQVSLVALAGALGTVLRFGVAFALAGKSTWPLATWLVNVLGSFLLGAVSESLAEVRFWEVDGRIVLGTGFLGGFTTYSAFNLETLRLFERGELGRGATYVALTVLACLVSGYLGLLLGRSLRG